MSAIDITDIKKCLGITTDIYDAQIECNAKAALECIE